MEDALVWASLPEEALESDGIKLTPEELRHRLWTTNITLDALSVKQDLDDGFTEPVDGYIAYMNDDNVREKHQQYLFTKLKKIHKDNPHNNEGKLANALVVEAYDDKSGDNISVAMSVLT